MSKQSSNISAIMGDFNVNPVNYASDTNTAKFYDLLSTHNFKPLILQPTRVTLRTATLINNIFIIDIICHSLGGNIAASISDHFFQFYQTDIFGTPKQKESLKYARDFRNFNERKVQEELVNIDWTEIVKETEGTEISYQNFIANWKKFLILWSPIEN